MIKKTMFFLWCVALVANFTVAQDAGKTVNSKQSVVFDRADDDRGVHNPNPSLNTRGASLITKTWNGYSTQASYTNQIYFEPNSGLLGVVHRTDRTGAGSGRVMYQVSDDFGANWSGQIGPVNQFGKVAGRHPNIGMSNPTNSTNVDDVAISLGIAELDATWRWAVLSTASAPGSTTYTGKLDSVFFPGDEMTSDNAGNLYSVWAVSEPWLGDTLAQNVLYRSTDKGATWTGKGMDKAADFGSATYNGTKTEFGNAAVGFYVVEGHNASDDYDFAYKKTTDNGATWDANFSWVNWKTATLGTATLGDSCHALNYEVDAIVHGADHLFVVGTFIDTTDGTATGVYVVSNTGSGWKAALVKLVNATSFALPGGLTALNEVEFARDKAGNNLFLKLLDLPAASDTAGDLFGTWYVGGSWTPLTNLTSSATVKEKYSQMASRLRTDGTNLTAFPMYTIFGLSDQSDVDESEYWLVTGVTINDVDDPTSVTVDNFELSQNYPNPFNPVTNIKYSIANNSNVKLVVFDMLGREVATLVNGAQNAGSYEVAFDASNLSSGIYVYTLTSGNFTSSKKLTLLK